MHQLGLIAGNGDFPILLARAARAHGVERLVAAAIRGETKPELADYVDEIEWIKLGQLARLIATFTRRGITQVVLAGGITHGKLFSHLAFDLRLLAVAARVKERNAETIFGALVEELHKDGIRVLDSRPLLGDAVPAVGCLTRRQPTAAQWDDIAFGRRIAKKIGELDIGQTVVVKKGTVLAVEAFEGTDECIRRGGALAGPAGGAVVVKMSKPNHDFRFDIPCVGPQTIESCAAGKIAVLAVEAGRSLLLHRERVLREAERIGLRLVAVESP